MQKLYTPHASAAPRTMKTIELTMMSLRLIPNWLYVEKW